MAIVEKPRLRGLFHLWAFFVAIVAGVMLIAFADGALPRFALVPGNNVVRMIAFFGGKVTVFDLMYA